ncbi:hypothetical protein [Streptomyces sp. NPDC127105]|uniref:hypothetical protein n=1 Tax=Streptomyces sp. NPDC127105 TaxID=3345359 RepID=UPI003669365D
MRVRILENVGAYYRAGRTYDIPDDEARGYISRDLAEPDDTNPETATDGDQAEPKASGDDQPNPGPAPAPGEAAKPAPKPAARTTGGRRGGKTAAAKTPQKED